MPNIGEKYKFHDGNFKGLRGEIVADDDKVSTVIVKFWTGNKQACSYEYIREFATKLDD